jgi:hypothetical protein
LLRGERLDLRTADSDRADGIAVAEQRRHEHGAYAQGEVGGLAPHEPPAGSFAEIPEMNRSPLSNHAVPDHIVGQWIRLTELVPCRQESVSGDHSCLVTLDQDDEGIVGLADLSRRPGYRP